MIGAVFMLNGLRRCALLVLAAAALVGAAIAPVASQGRSQAQAQPQLLGVATSVDPIALENQIKANPDFDAASLWRSLKIPAALDTLYAKVGATPPASAKTPFDRCGNTCLAQLTRADLDGDGRNEAILAIYKESGFCRLLVFSENQSPAGTPNWRFVGHTDHDALGQYEPEYRVSFTAGRYFVMVAPVAVDEEVRVRYERWYEVSPAGMREVLTLPAEGIECRDGRSLCRAFGSTVGASRTGKLGEELLASFTVRYWGDRLLLGESLSDPIPLFGRTQRAVFMRPLKSSEPYELSGMDSDIASWELTTVFRLGALSCQDFLVSNPDNLARIASDRGSAARSWLARYVDACPASKERTALLEQLGK